LAKRGYILKTLKFYQATHERVQYKANTHKVSSSQPFKTCCRLPFRVATMYMAYPTMYEGHPL
jgi:hypothetical protein